jgi:AraC family transcriptional regulator
MKITRRILLDRGLWRIIQIDVRPTSSALGEIESEDENILVLPTAGVFAKHEGPRHRVTGTPNDAVLIGAGRPYRLRFPGGIGDRCLTVRFSNDALAQLLSISQLPSELLAAPMLLPANLLLARNLLWRRFQTGQLEELEIDELGGMLVEATLQLADVDGKSRQPNIIGRLSSIETVKEAVALCPAYKWSLEELAQLANVSPFHLSRLFRQATGTSIYGYVLRARLAAALEFLIDTKMDLTAIGLEVGFSSHSHFTARFRTFFGMTPTVFRQTANTVMASEMRRIMTASKAGSW